MAHHGGKEVGLRRAIGELTAAGLIDASMTPKEPPAGMFHLMANSNLPWQRRFQYFPLYKQRQRTLSRSHNAVLCLLISWMRKNGAVGTSAMATQLRVNRLTVQRAMTKLRADGYLDGDGVPTAKCLGLWLDANERKPKKAPVGNKDEFVRWLVDLSDMMDDILWRWLGGHCDSMLSRNYTKPQIIAYWEMVLKSPKAEYFVKNQFAGHFDRAEEITGLNRSRGSFVGENSLGLLTRFTKQALYHRSQSH
jgi:hypothetical protein